MVWYNVITITGKMAQSSLFLGVLLLLTVWSVRSGNNAESSVAAPTGNMGPNDFNRLKTVLTKTWSLADPLAVSYAALAYSVMRLEIPKSKVCHAMEYESFISASVFFHLLFESVWILGSLLIFNVLNGRS